MNGHLRRLSLLFLAVLAVAPSTASSQTAPSKDSDALLDFFEKKVRPVLANNCYNCHSANTNTKSGLRVDDRKGLIDGGQRGAAIVPGHPEKSLLIQAAAHSLPKLKMPPQKKLTIEEVADLSQWIKDGAVWPQAKLPASIGRYEEKYAQLRKEHWAFQPVREPKTPSVQNAAWAYDDIDRFLLAALEKKKLKPVGDADRLSLLRRVTFDLTGLPPTPEEIDVFRKDTSAQAFEKVVDRLLASPAYGERWGRHWLDVARYGESTGSARNLPYPQAWRYRDYVIDAFQRDMPYDQFIREQIAGDLLPAQTQEQRNKQLIATGFLALGVKDVNQRFKIRFVMDNIDEQIDTVTRSVLALTASCARCHDHKFDPIPTADYYALAGIFNSTDHCSGLRNKMGGSGLAYYDTSLLLHLGAGGVKNPTAEDLERIEVAKAAFEKAKAEFDAIFQTPAGKALNANGKPKQMDARLRMNAREKELLALTDPSGRAQVALGVRDSKTTGDTEIRIRGEAEKLGPVVPRGNLTAFHVPDAPKINPNQSGRLELAQSLVSTKNPLAPRVMVNRIWKHLFGLGLVASVDNFGITGDPPSNLELLDHLATRFIQNQWSVKKLVRSLVLTHAYRLGSEATAEHLTADPANRLVWRHSPRRLDAEEIRDAMLASAGTLDRNRPVGSPAMNLPVVELRNNGPEARRIEDEGEAAKVRSVYLPLLRGLTPRALDVFDFAEQGMVTGSRDTTTVATQALYLLNDSFVRQQSLALAQRLLQEKGDEDSARVQLVYQWTLGRSATSGEIERARAYVSDYEASARSEETKTPRLAAWASFCQAILASAEFRYIQ